MSILSFALIFATILVASYFFFKQSKPSKPERLRSKNTQSNKGKEYRSVVIQQGKQACQAAMRFKNTPILMNKAPSLPLPDCDQVNCTCKFLKYDDRRQDERRSALHVARQQIGDDASNSRAGSDRRESA